MNIFCDFFSSLFIHLFLNIKIKIKNNSRMTVNYADKVYQVSIILCYKMFSGKG